MATNKIVDSNGLLYYHQLLKGALAKKVDVKTGYSLMSDTEIKRLASVINYDDTDVKKTLDSLSDKITKLQESAYDDTEIRNLIAGIQSDVTALKNKVANWDAAYTHSQSEHARTDATAVTASETNGNIKINGTETKVYTHPTSGATAGTYRSVTVDKNGHVTGGTNPTTLDGYGITDAAKKDDLTTHTGNTTIHITADERTSWNAAKTHANSAHAPSNAQANIIETVKVNGTALAATSKAVDITVPTKVSELTNDSKYLTAVPAGYVTETALAAKGYAVASNVYTKTEIDTKLTSAVRYKGSVKTFGDLPTTDQATGDMYNIEGDDAAHGVRAGDNVVWNGTTWDNVGSYIDLTDYVTVNDIIQNTDIDTIWAS